MTVKLRATVVDFGEIAAFEKGRSLMRSLMRSKMFALSALAFSALAALDGCAGSRGAVPAATGGAQPLAAVRSTRVASATAALEARPASALRHRDVVATALSNTTTADPPVPRPDTTPCVVSLFTGLTFADFSPKPYQFAPPAACPGPWAKVVFEGDFGVSAGRQFDRTATIGLGGSTIYFGTTAEPSRTLARTWHVESDLTDLSALFAKAQNGQISIGNIVNATYTGVLSASAKLDFYPADDAFPAPRVADVVVPLADASGNPVALQTTSDQLGTSFVPPTNVERAYLDVIAQSQIGDEFWYTCFPNDLAGPLNNCGNTAFRETEVAVDGRAAGAAPVYPWIYTGGIDPYLWRPIPGVQTLNFLPYRVDLSPFAGVLDDGASHRVALSVFNANHYFSVTGNLLLFLDRDATGPLAGAVDADGASTTPPESVVEGGSFDANGFGSGTIDTTSKRSFAIVGHVNTSHGIVRSDVEQTLAFTQHQDIVSTATRFVQNIKEDTSIVSRVQTTSGAEPKNVETSFDWPLVLDFAFAVAPDGSATQTTSIQQGYVAHVASHGGGKAFASDRSDRVTPTDTLAFDASGAFLGPSGSSAQTYAYRDTTGICYGRTIASTNGTITTNAPAPCTVPAGNP